MTEKKENSKTFLLQLLKFGIVGMSNTLITAAAIALLLEGLHADNFTANIAGYIVGLTNSFVWNRRWTFRAKNSMKASIIKFILTFAVSYAAQWAVVSALLRLWTGNAYLCHLAGMVVYTVLNFLLNKHYTFKTTAK